MHTPLIRQGNIDSLTGFRFVAAMMVFFSHYAIPGVTGTALRVTESGYAGVTLFFVLSGFVIAYNYLERFEEGMTGQTVGAYFAARLARLYPLYICFIAFGWLVKGSSTIPWAHILAVQTWSPDAEFATSINGPAWSIGVEVFLYLAFPLLLPVLIWLRALSSLRRLSVATALVSVAMLCAALYFALSGQNALPYQDPTSGHRWLYRTPATRLGDFLLGIFGAVYVMRFAKTDRATIRRWGFVTLCAALLLLLLLATRKNYRSAFSWDVAYALPGILLIVGLAINRGTLFSRALASPALVLLGEASYAFYLVHVPARPLRAGTEGGLPFELALYVMFLGLVIALSIGLHIAVEKPARRWVRAWLTPRPRTPAAVQERGPAQAETR
ncbi:MAG: hypothetical protein JWQ33_2144 [Ramlibacter sp.]|nr:hypothetical protein [Ramlibacter sp.]